MAHGQRSVGSVGNTNAPRPRSPAAGPRPLRHNGHGWGPPSLDESRLSFGHAEAERHRTRVVPKSPAIT
jgi:hypothetical protein